MFDAFPVVIRKVFCYKYLTLLRNNPPFPVMLLSVFLKSKSKSRIDEQNLSRSTFGLFFAQAVKFTLAKAEIPNAIWLRQPGGEQKKEKWECRY
ncbi:hypothetical protein ACNVD4_26055 [Rhizobium sp. BR5]